MEIYKENRFLPPGFSDSLREGKREIFSHFNLYFCSVKLREILFQCEIGMEDGRFIYTKRKRLIR